MTRRQEGTNGAALGSGEAPSSTEMREKLRCRSGRRERNKIIYSRVLYILNEVKAELSVENVKRTVMGLVPTGI